MCDFVGIVEKCIKKMLDRIMLVQAICMKTFKGGIKVSQKIGFENIYFWKKSIKYLIDF
jgi:hypothetical protein